MAGSTTTTLNDLLPAIVAEAMFVANERSIMRGLVKTYNLGAGQGKTVTVPIYGQQTAASLTEGNEVSNTAVSTTAETLTVSTVAIRTMLTDLVRTSAASNVVADLGRLFGEAVARKLDMDLTALFATLAAGDGNYGAAITPEVIFQAVAKLKATGVSTDGMVCVLHPEIAYDLKAALTTGGASGAFTMGAWSDIANEAMKEGFVARIAGINIFETSNIAHVTNIGDFPGAVFHMSAIGLAMIGDIAIETQRRASFLADDIVASVMMSWPRTLNCSRLMKACLKKL